MTEVVTVYPFPNVRDNYPPLKLVDRTSKGFTISCQTNFVERHAGDPRLRTAYNIVLGDEILCKRYNTFSICNTVELTIEAGYTDKSGKKGYLLTEKDDEGTNTYFADQDTLEVTTIRGELLHFMMGQQSAFATERLRQNDTGEVESVEFKQTRGVLHPHGCC